MAQDGIQSKVIRGRKHAAKYAGIGSTQSWVLERAGQFPKPLALGVRARGWLISELDDFLNQRAAERDGQHSE